MEEGKLLIQSKADYEFYLEADRLSLRIPRTSPMLIGDEIWKFQRVLRKIEYYRNCKKGPLSQLVLKFLYLRYHFLSLSLGVTIPPNVFGPGLAIAHRGPVLVNYMVKVGENCRINIDVVIGTKSYCSDGAPEIGDNVFIGPGAKIFGPIAIADSIAVGANAAVNKSFQEPGITIAGVPARKINQKGSGGLLVKGSEIARKGEDVNCRDCRIHDD